MDSDSPYFGGVVIRIGKLSASRRGEEAADRVFSNEPWKKRRTNRDAVSRRKDARMADVVS
jgi:hypothetical protein